MSGDIGLITGAVAGTFGAVTGGYVPTYAAGSVTIRRPGGEEPKPLAAAPAFAAPVTIGAAPKGAPVHTGRTLKLVVRTCPACGSVKVTWAGITRTVSLKGAKGRRTVTVVRLKRARTGTVRTSRAVERVIVSR